MYMVSDNWEYELISCIPLIGTPSPGPVDIYRTLGLQQQQQQQDWLRQAQQAQVQGQQAQPVRTDYANTSDLFSDKKWAALNSLLYNSADQYAIERAAKMYRNAACE